MKRRRFEPYLKKIKNRNDVVLSLEETKRRRFVWSPASKPTGPVLPFQSEPVFGGRGMGGGGGGGEGRREGRRSAAFRWPENSPLTEVPTAAVDDRFGPTSERGVDVDGRLRRGR